MKAVPTAIGFLIIISYPASAMALFESLGFSVSADLGVTAGLDKDTRDLIKLFPEEIKLQMLDGLSKSLPMIDSSVHGYLDRIDNLVNNAGVTAYCTVYGGVAGGKDALRGVESRAKELEREHYRTRSQFGRRTSPKEYESSYSVIEHKASSYMCPLVAGTLQWKDIMSVKIKSHDAGFMWSRLIPMCDTAYGCEQVVRAQVNALLDTVHPQDVESVGAVVRMKAITPMPMPKFWNDGYKIDQVEGNLSTMLRINDELVIAKYNRDTKGEKALQSYNEKYAGLRSKYDEAISIAPIRLPSHAQATPACRLIKQSPSLISELAGDYKALKSLGYLSPEAARQIDKSYSDLNQNISNLMSVVDAKQNLNVRSGQCYIKLFNSGPIGGIDLPVN